MTNIKSPGEVCKDSGGSLNINLYPSKYKKQIPNHSNNSTKYWRGVLACYDKNAVLLMVNESKIHFSNGVGRYQINHRELEEAACG